MPGIGVPVSAAPDQNRALNSSRIAMIGPPVCEARAITSINRWRRIAPSKQGLPFAVADAFAEHGVELRDHCRARPRPDLVSGTIAVLGRDRQLPELGPLACESEPRSSRA